MGDLLTAVSTIKLNDGDNEQATTIVQASPHKDINVQVAALETSDDALGILRSQPSREQLSGVVRYLLNSPHHAFDITTAGPAAARIIAELINTTIFDYADRDDSARKDLLRCLCSIAGINAVNAKIRLLSSHDPKAADAQRLYVLLQTLQDVLAGDHVLTQLWSQVERATDPQPKQALLQKELVSVLASGKIVSVAAEGQAKYDAVASTKSSIWLSDGSQYSSWLARNICHLINSKVDHASGSLLSTSALLLSRGLAIGYPAQLIASLYNTACLQDQHLSLKCISTLVAALSLRDQSRFFEYTLHFCTTYFHLAEIPETMASHNSIQKSLALLHAVSDTPRAREILMSWISDPVRNCIEPVAAHRAVLSLLAAEFKCLERVLLENGRLFGDAMFINHAPLIQQEACAQIILLTSALLAPNQPEIVRKFARSSDLTNGTTKRLSASSHQARVLGMLVCMALSKLVDPIAQRMDFKVDEVRTEQALMYFSLVENAKVVKPIHDLGQLKLQGSATGEKAQLSNGLRSIALSEKPQTSRPVRKATKASAHASRVIELLYDDEDRTDLVPYAKPDSDPDDDDDDPTLVNREKPRAPVYIRDLIAGLQDQSSFDRHALALRTAAPLIRRKANFGKEVNDHAVELRSILVGLGDNFDIDDFAELRLQALIALLVADPRNTAPAYARLAFEGDYSTSQRATVLSAIGLAARELAGHKDDDLNPVAQDTFPSKKLPDRLHSIYAPEVANLGAISSRMSQQMLGPLAAEALESTSGPRALQTRKFSSRMDVAKRHKTIPNDMAKLLAEFFFTPLVGHYWAHTQAYRTSYSPFTSPVLLATFLKTLAIMLHASGPGTVSLPSLTTDFWDVLLSARSRALEKVEVLEAVLFGLLTLLEANHDQRSLAEGYSRQLIETQKWVEMVYGRLTEGGHGSAGVSDGQGDKVRMLAVGILMQLNEIMEKYQRLLMGTTFDYQVQ